MTAQGEASVLQLLGLRPAGLLPALAAPLALTACLFAGPLLLLAWPARPSYARETLLSLPRLQARPPCALHPLPQSHSSLITIHIAGAQVLRNVLVAPLTEEFVFRACMAPMLLARVRGHSVQAMQG